MNNPAPSANGRSYTVLAVGIIIAAVIVSASILAAFTLKTTVTKTSVDTKIETTTLTLFTSGSGVLTTENSTIQAECSHAQAPTLVGLTFGEITAGTKSPAILCVQLYYFNSTAPTTIDLGPALSIWAQQYIQNGSVAYPRSFDGAPNFTVATNPDDVVLGGPTNQSEGVVVAFALTAKAGASGTYELGFFSYPGMGGNAWELTAQEPVRCGYYGELVAGSGQPDYTNVGGCITYTVSHSGTTSTGPTIPGVQYPILKGYIYFRVVGVVNPM